MGKNFRPVERDQQYLLPPSLRDWLPADDLAWFVLDVIDQIDLSAVRARYRDDGWGAPAYEPALMVALLVYAYATGERSSRRIERLCERDIAYRVIAANQRPDHATIARFRAAHETALAALFGEVLRLCAAAGLGRLGLIALDGTKLAANAAFAASRTADMLDAEIARILAEAAATDAAEDAAAVSPESEGLPPALANPRSRLAHLVAARRRLSASTVVAAPSTEPPAAEPAPRPRRARKPARVNTTDPDSRAMKAVRGFVQGYNGQASAAEDGLILAAELTQDRSDVHQLRPLLAVTLANIAAAGFSTPVGSILADAGYWSERNLSDLPAETPELLIPPTTGRPARPGGRRPPPAKARMRALLGTERAARLYARRAVIIEPVFGHLKAVRGYRRFQRRGLAACAAEWRLMCTAHNLLKLWRSRRAGGSSIAATFLAACAGQAD